MRDLVRELRSVDHSSVEDCFLLSPLFGHAADEIERLRREVQEARAAALQEAAQVGRKSVMQFKAKFGGYGKYYPGYHEDLREYVAAEIRKLKDPAP